MSTVEKLLIKGIRSFSPDNTTVIEFYKPLTLIVGANGAGKTTVIECLKQACTGELPPNTRSGQSFIHDPKVSNETETKAQIKLRFKTSNGQPVVVLRSFQLTQKAKQLQFKTLDCTVQTNDRATGEKQAVTYRCGDLDKLVPSMMGVSKAVLENVIFVHQEESNWPLSEGKVLKDRFDDIFSATKYTKALEALRKMRCEKVQEAKELKLRMETTKTNRNNSLRLRREVAEAKERMISIENEIRDLQAQIQVKNAAATELDAKIAHVAQLNQCSVRLRTQVEQKEQQVAQLYTKLPGGEDYDESTETLVKHRDMLDEGMEKLRRDADLQGRQAWATRLEGQALKERFAQDCMKHGRLVAEAAQHADHIRERDRFIREAALKLSITIAEPSGDEGLPAAVVQTFHVELKSKCQTLEMALLQLKAANRRNDEDLAAALDNKSAAMAAVSESLRACSDQKQRHKAEHDNLSEQVDLYVVSSAQLEQARVLEQEAVALLEHAKAEQASSQAEVALMREREALDDIQRKISRLRLEREQVANATEDLTRLAMLRKDLLEKQAAIAATLGSKRRLLLGLLGATVLPPTDRLRDAADQALALKRQEIQKQRHVMEDSQMRQQTTQGQLNSAHAQLMSADALLSNLNRELRDGMAQAKCAGSENDFQNEMTQRAEKHQEILGRMKEAHAFGQVLGTFKKSAQESPACPLCRRDFHGNDQAECVSRIEADMQSLPAEIEKRTKRLARIQAEVDLLTKLQPKAARQVDLSKRELPELRERVFLLEQQLAELDREVEDKSSLFALADNDLADAQKLCTESVWQLDRQHKEAMQLKDQVSRLEAMTAAGSGARTVIDVDNDLQTLQEERTQLEQAREKVQARREKLANKMLMASQKHALAQSERAAIEEKLHRKEACEAKAQELGAAEVHLDGQIRNLMEQQRPLELERERLIRERNSARAESARHEAMAEAVLRDAALLADSYSAKCQPIEDYSRRGRVEQLALMTSEIGELRQRVDANDQRVHDLDKAVSNSERQIAGKDALKRELGDVLDWRFAREELEKMMAEKDVVEAQIEQVGDSAALVAALATVERAAKDLRTRQDMLQGQITAMQAGINRVSKDLSAPVYKDIDEAYRAELIKLTALQMGNADLEKYHKALEKALLTFHTTKMEDINKIIKEMWQKTYRGQDIDHIQIKADADGARSYNYRVVMYSGGAELEMRGRCSAGQKVLACLIIRLALAETFCLNCGILALDEPTTNLDVENSQALAEELRSIMVARRDQSNFQLIVITHDEAFAHSIGTQEHADTMWRITKDENQHTKVTAEAID